MTEVGLPFDRLMPSIVANGDGCMFAPAKAVVKALGTGLSTPLDSFEVALGASTPALAMAPEGAPQTWWLHAAMADGYCRALAVPGVGEVELIQRTV